METTKELTPEQQKELLYILQERFEKNKQRHPGLAWCDIQAKLEQNPSKLSILHAMETTGGEPDVVSYDTKTNDYVFFDCSAESPKERRSLCYDREALDGRKEHKPKNSVLDMATEMGITLLSQEQYYALQQLGQFDTKTSSWIATPAAIRKLGGALFGDCRYDTVFIYHNGAESYYAARGFRGAISV